MQFSKFVLALAIGAPGHLLALVPSNKATVIVDPIQITELSDVLTYPGRVKSRLNATMTSEIDGQVIKIEKNLGARINKGDVVLTLQNIDPVYRYAPIKIRSTHSGYLTSLNVDLMQNVQRGSKLYTVTDPQDLFIEVEIPANDLKHLRTGQSGTFKTDPLGTETLNVIIEGLAPIVDITTGTATARLKPLEKTNMLNQGQIGQFSIRTNMRQSMLVPDSAIFYKEDKPFVRVLKGKRLVKIPIVLGPRMGGSFEILSGLRAGEQIVLRTSRFVADNEEVEVENSAKIE